MSKYYHFACSSQGYNHIKIGKVCQDSCGESVFNDVTIIAVADGHGSDNYVRTDRGSSFAVTAAIDAIRGFIVNSRNNDVDFIGNAEDCLTQICKNILAKWHELVEEDVLHHPFQGFEMENVSEKYKRKYASGRFNAKAYGTTLIAICKTDDFWFGIHIGDGKCIEISIDGRIYEPIPWDSQCEQNITTSICDGDAIEEFRFAFGTELPAAIFIGSDGIDDSYPTSEELHELYRSILEIFSEHGDQVGFQEVRSYLPKISRQGSGDDVSIAGIINAELTKAQLERIRLRGKIIKAQNELDQARRMYQTSIEKKQYIEKALEKNRNEYQNLYEKMSRAEADITNAEKALARAEAEWSRLHTAIDETPTSHDTWKSERASEAILNSVSETQGTHNQKNDGLSSKEDKSIVRQDTLPDQLKTEKLCPSVFDEHRMDLSEVFHPNDWNDIDYTVHS